MNSNLLKAKRVERGLSQVAMAEKLGIAEKTYIWKENGVTEFNRLHLEKVRKILKLSNKDMINIFFN